MSELLLELFYEEIPALMQKEAEERYCDIFTKVFQKNNIKYKTLDIYITPRRITLHVNGINEMMQSQNVEFKGPAVDAPKNAIEGFCKSHEISKQDLITRSIKDREFYFYTKTIKAIQIKNWLLEILPNAIKEYIWPKSMHWGEYDLQSVRPLRNILCIFNETVIPFKLGHLKANNISFGHRFMGLQNVVIKDFATYKVFMEDNYVILSRDKRKEIIKNEIDKIAVGHNLKIIEDEKLLEEVVGLVEYPVAMMGKINPKFLKLPKEVLISSIRTHQKYFNLSDANGNIFPYFIFISNLKSQDPEVIIKGNQRVLSARLSDALYFYEEDLKKSLETYTESLKSMMFHAKLGNMHEKTQRIFKICNYLDPENIELHIAAKLCKSDLVSEVVTEFPELQGIMGYYYALNEGLSFETASAIYHHYKPLGPEGEIPGGNGGLLAIADKIDSLVGLMIADEVPTGSKDPYALRRAALGIIRIILENHLKFDIKALISFTYSLYDIKMTNVCETVLEFINERLKHYFRARYGHNVIQASIDLTLDGNIVKSYHILRALTDFLGSIKGVNCLSLYKRVCNILGDKNIAGNVDEELFVSEYEKKLFANLTEVTKQVDIALEEMHYEQALNFLDYLYISVCDFFDNIMVNDQDPKLTHNRLLLMQNIKIIFDKIARFDIL